MIQCNECNQHPCKCNLTVPVNPVNLFGSPFDCKPQIPTRRFASPNSHFPQEELDELQICIEAVNDLLRSLGSVSNPNNTRQLQLHFLDLKGVSVNASILCGVELSIDNELVNDEKINSNIIEVDDDDVAEIEVINAENKNRNKKENDFENQKSRCIKLIRKKGKLATAGRDFIQINPVGSAIFILYRKLLSVARIECEEEERDPKFINADQETRRELAFNFGEFVSKNKDIENLFFGIPLYKALTKYVGKDVKVRTNEDLLYGTLIHVREGKVQIQNNKMKKEIDIQSICYLKVLDLK